MATKYRCKLRHDASPGQRRWKCRALSWARATRVLSACFVLGLSMQAGLASPAATPTTGADTPEAVTTKALTPTVQRTPFDHLLTTFELIGKHRDVPCEECHVGARFKGTPRDCASCHGLGAQVHGVGKPVSHILTTCLLYTSPSPRDRQKSRMPSSA